MRVILFDEELGSVIDECGKSEGDFRVFGDD
jgi:hypothetical protein